MKQKQDSDCDCSLYSPAVCKQKAVQCRQIFCFHQDTALQIPHHDQRKHNFVCGESEDKGKQDNPINSKSLSKRVQKAGKDEVKKRVLEMLRLVGIADAKGCVKKYPHELSGGMRQRVMIATALAGNPEILIADEPTTALDVTIQAQIMDLLVEIQQKLGMTVILITHDLGVVANSADRVVVMYSGKVVETGTCTEIFEKHKHPYTWALLKAAPDMELGSKQKLVAIEGTPPDLILPPKGCPFAERCGHCMKICLETEAPRYTFSKDHSVFCWLYHPESGYTDITFDEGEIE